MNFVYPLIIFFISLQVSSISYAAFKIKPGLWEIQSKTSVNGQPVDAAKQMNQALQKMSPAQRQQMESMMGAKGINFGDKGIKVCHTNKVSTEQNLIQKDKSNCKITDKKELSDGIKFNIKCETGSGAAEYHWTSENSYKGWNEFQTKQGKSRTEFSGQFLSADCGSVKPMG